MAEDVDLNACTQRDRPDTEHFNALLRRHRVTVRQLSRVDDGWLGILDALFDDLRAPGGAGHATQITERHGQLSVYVDPES